MKGTGVALVTPFKKDSTIDFDALGNIIDHVIGGGVEYVVALGTTGEAPTLSSAEKKEVYSFIAQRAKGKAGCVAGIGGNNTAEVVEAIKAFNFDGYDAVLSVSPYYNKPNQEGLYQHYMEVGNASPLPVMLYNVPGRTGMSISAATTLRLAHASDKFICTKEASGNAEQIMDIIHGKPERFSVISGDDNLTVPFIAMGMNGVISVIANAYPRDYSDMVRAALAGDFAEARRIHYRIYEVMKAIYLDGSPGGIKAVLNKIGLCENVLRLPLAPVNKQLEERLCQIVATLK